MQNSELIKKIEAKKRKNNLDRFLLMCTNKNLDVPASFKKAAKDTLNEMNRIDKAMKKLKQEERNVNRFLKNLMENDSNFFENIGKLQQQLDALNNKSTQAKPPAPPQPKTTRQPQQSSTVPTNRS